MLICHLSMFFGEVSGNICCLFLNRISFLLLSFKNFTYVWIRVPYQACDLLIFFSQSLSCLLICLLCLQQSRIFLNFGEFHFYQFFSCIIHALNFVSKNSSPSPRLFIFSPLCSLKSFITLYLTVRAIISFELAFRV